MNSQTGTENTEQAEQARSCAEARHLAVFDNAVVGIAETSPRGQYRRVNKKFRDITGYGEDELFALTEQRITHPDDVADCAEATRQMIEGAMASCAAERRYIRKDGSVVWVELEISLVRHPDGAADQFVTVARDITERKRAEESLRQARLAADAANMAKADFQSRMSHQLRTPLNAILLYTQMLIEDVEETGSTNALADLEKVNLSGRHLLEMINDLLNPSKIRRGIVEIVASDFPLDDLIAQVEAAARPWAEQKRLAFEVARPERLGLMHSDRAKLRECLMNLLTNAAEFTDQGTVNLRVEEVDVDGDSWLRFVVKDTGADMSQEQIRRHVEPRLPGGMLASMHTMAEEADGSITQQLVSVLRGKLHVECHPGEGTLFVVEVPRDVLTASD